MSTGKRPPGLRERKKLETRATLATIAVRLAVERGIDNVTVDDIAAEAGVSARTFFNYFPSKEDAVLQPDADPVGDTRAVAEAFLAAPAGLSPVRALAGAWRPVAERLDREQADWLARISIIERQPELIAKMFTVRAETERVMVHAIGVRTGLDPGTHLYPQLVLEVVGAAVQAAVKRWYALGGSVPFSGLYDEAIDAVAGGLPAPPRDEGNR